ncbi:hypothetical protein POM88_023728 [Heracleum sosnowskyi]|uniref:Uncharacterized protein n=1 Tax=Heracleum sosnowskyi TaxID=360622 RepID=A0AAD8IK14_9APIA|nr:hypothetical protein POM88_023728 [Heracleum sosnowskyi]
MALSSEVSKTMYCILLMSINKYNASILDRLQPTLLTCHGQRRDIYISYFECSLFVDKILENISEGSSINSFGNVAVLYRRQVKCQEKSSKKPSETETFHSTSTVWRSTEKSYALYDMVGNKVPQELVTEVGVTFKSIMDKANQVRAENNEDMSVSRAISVVFERRPDLRLDGLPHKVLQWYLCGMEGWFTADADIISLKCWDQEELLPGGHGILIQCSMFTRSFSKGLWNLYNQPRD